MHLNGERVYWIHSLMVKVEMDTEEQNRFGQQAPCLRALDITVTTKSTVSLDW